MCKKCDEVKIEAFSEREEKILFSGLKMMMKVGDQADELAYALYGLIGGDDPDHAAALLEKYGYVDENGEWIGE